MKLLSIICFAFFFCFQSFGQGQNLKPDTSQKNMQDLSDLLKKGGQILAVERLEEIVSEYPQNYPSRLLLGKAYLELKRWDLAEKNFSALVGRKYKKADPFLWYYLGKCQFLQEKNKEAEQSLKNFEASRPPFQAQFWADWKLMKYRLGNLEPLKVAQQKFEMDTLFQFPNSAYADFSPIPLGDTAFIFSSLRRDSLAEMTTGEPNFNTIHLFHYKIRPDGKFDEIFQLKKLNPPGYHNGNGSFSKDGKRFFFTRCTDGEKGNLKCQIYEAEVKPDGEYHKVKKLNDRINKTKYSASQPLFLTLFVNGVEQDVLFFVSNRRGGFGQNDIWYSLYNRKKKRFSSPQNAGSVINSPGNEASPFVDSAQNKMYFSSDGFPGFGGKDVFFAKMNGLSFSKRELLDKPINSIADDHYFYICPNEKSGFLASNRKGANLLDQKYCCEDVFRFQVPPPPKPKPDTQVIANVEKSPLEADTLQKLPNPEKPVFEALSNPKGELNPLKKNEIARSLQQTENHPEFEKKFVGRPQPEWEKKLFYFQTNSYRLSPMTQKQIRKLALLLKNLKPSEILITGFADIRGTPEHNAVLAHNRALAVKRFLQMLKVGRTIKLQTPDLKKAIQTKDQDLLATDRHAEIAWKKKVNLLGKNF
jgi:outer membrane protein OmpA-like peptidoglycan-associated protein